MKMETLVKILSRAWKEDLKKGKIRIKNLLKPISAGR